MPISVQEQKDKPSKIYTYQQPVPKLKNAYYLDIFVVVLVDLMFGLSIIWLYTCFGVSGGEKEFVKKKIQIKA